MWPRAWSRIPVSYTHLALAGTALEYVPLWGMVKYDHHRTRAMVDSEGREIAINMNRGTFTFITAIPVSYTHLNCAVSLDKLHVFWYTPSVKQMNFTSRTRNTSRIPGVTRNGKRSGTVSYTHLITLQT